jgi:hypothetical protein
MWPVSTLCLECSSHTSIGRPSIPRFSNWRTRSGKVGPSGAMVSPRMRLPARRSHTPPHTSSCTHPLSRGGIRRASPARE